MSSNKYILSLTTIPSRINYIKPPYNSLIYTEETSSSIDSLVSIKNKYNRYNLNNQLNNIVSNLKNEGKFDNIIHNR